jgi:hypothetical protein
MLKVWGRRSSLNVQKVMWRSESSGLCTSTSTRAVGCLFSRNNGRHAAAARMSTS